MMTIPYSASQVKALRDQMKTYGEKLATSQVWDVLRTTGDFDLALTALVMKPRPDWVTTLLKGEQK